MFSYVSFIIAIEDDNSNNIIFAIRDTKSSVYWKGYKTKIDNETTTNDFKYFLKSNFFEVNRLVVFV